MFIGIGGNFPGNLYVKFKLVKCYEKVKKEMFVSITYDEASSDKIGRGNKVANFPKVPRYKLVCNFVHYFPFPQSTFTNFLRLILLYRKFESFLKPLYSYSSAFILSSMML